MTRRKSLSTVVAEALAARIRGGDWPPGTRLPTEAELCAAHEVSRTVIREAVARLRSEGLVVAEQGRGVFVSEAPALGSFSIPQEALRTLPETIALLELRLSVEVESAGLCAERRSDAQAAAIRTLMEETDARRVDPQTVNIHYDYDFHLAIARATGNAFIHGFLNYLRPVIVPRFQLGHVVLPDLKDAYYARIHEEHLALVEAIERRDAPAARRAMRLHLGNSLERVRALAAAAGLAATGSDQADAARALFAELQRQADAAG